MSLLWRCCVGLSAASIEPPSQIPCAAWFCRV
jgi:hypothetical protein